MSRASLLGITIERFKSFAARTEVEFAPLTIILGRNNSGKSSLIQALLLLKQTLAIPRPEIPLHLDGAVSALSLRELTHGWPAAGERVAGPSITLRWSTEFDVEAASDQTGNRDPQAFADAFGAFRWNYLDDATSLVTELQLDFEDHNGTTVLAALRLSTPKAAKVPQYRFHPGPHGWTCEWPGDPGDGLAVEIDHFLPDLRRFPGKSPNTVMAFLHRACSRVVGHTIEALKRLLSDFQYLGATRFEPPALFRAANVAPQELGVSGEWAAQLLHRRQRDMVHYLPPLHLSPQGAEVPPLVRQRPLVEAVNDILHQLSLQTTLSVDEIQNVGFRLLFGSANLAHVGRGLTHLLPLIELGLLADPLRFESTGPDTPLADYRQQCPTISHIAVDEPEAHLHPKVQSRLAHWLVSLAMSSRRLLVETHSDHLVRRLRGLVARAGAGSELEAWLLQNVVILEVEQDEQGRSSLRSSRLTADGGIGERWPADFMDEASDEDSAIYYARLDKAETRPSLASGLIYTDEEEPDLEDMP
jgi:hypothetical protein